MKGLLMIFLATLFIAIGGEKAAAQLAQSYEIAYDPGVDNLELYHSVLQTGSIDRYRLPYSRSTMLFDSGVKVSLLSAEELLEKGIAMDMSRYLGREETLTSESVFTAHESGMLLEMKMAPKPVQVKKQK